MMKSADKVNVTVHAKAFKKAMIRITLIFIVAMAVLWQVTDQTLAYLISLTEAAIITISPFEMLHAKINIAFVSAVIICLPYVYIELYKFISPALYKKERTVIRWSTVPFFVMFSIGGVFALLVFIPVVLHYVSLFYITDIANSITLGSYIDFILMAVVMFGIVFCMPIVLSILSYIGLINTAVMKAYRKHVYLSLLIVGAVITPPDVFTQAMVSIPLILLYELSVIISYILTSISNKHEVSTHG